MQKECAEVSVTTSPQPIEIANASLTPEFIESTASSLTTSLSAITTALPDFNTVIITAISIPIAVLVLSLIIAVEVVHRYKKRTPPSAAFFACMKQIYQKPKSASDSNQGASY